MAASGCGPPNLRPVVWYNWLLGPGPLPLPHFARNFGITRWKREYRNDARRLLDFGGLERKNGPLGKLFGQSSSERSESSVERDPRLGNSSIQRGSVTNYDQLPGNWSQWIYTQCGWKGEWLGTRSYSSAHESSQVW